MTTNEAITVNETSSGRYIGVQFFLVRKADKVIALIAKKDDSADWLVSRQDSPKFSRTRGFNARCLDKDAAVANLARYLGMMVDRKEISGPNGGPVPLAHITADDLTDDQLAAILKADEEEAAE